MFAFIERAHMVDARQRFGRVIADPDAAFKTQPEIAGAQQIDSCSSGPTHQLQACCTGSMISKPRLGW